MRRCVIVLCILAALTVPVLAMDVLEEERQILNVDTLTDGLPDDAQDALRAPALRRAQTQEKQFLQSLNGRPDCQSVRCAKLCRRLPCCCRLRLSASLSGRASRTTGCIFRP